MDSFVEIVNGMYTVYDDHANKKFESEEPLTIVDGNQGLLSDKCGKFLYFICIQR